MKMTDGYHHDALESFAIEDVFKRNGEKRWPHAGDKMRFLDENGYPMDLTEARKHFIKDQILTVRDFHLGDWNSTIAFEEFGGHFNSVMFERVEISDE